MNSYRIDIWSSEEDILLRSVVDKQGAQNWTKIAAQISERNPKQCRERWHNHLDVGVKKGEWTVDEDKIIITSQEKFGNQWSQITLLLNGRTDNDVKNRYHSLRRALTKPDSIELRSKGIETQQLTTDNLESLRLQRLKRSQEIERSKTKLRRDSIESDSTNETSESDIDDTTDLDPIEQEILDFLASDIDQLALNGNVYELIVPISDDAPDKL